MQSESSYGGTYGAAMLNVPILQAGATKAPPIPTMVVNPAPPATTAADVRRSVRDIASRTKAAVREARLSAQNAAKDAQSNAPTASTTVPTHTSDDIPPMVGDFLTTLCVTFAIVIIGFPLSRAFARRIDRSKTAPAVSGPDLTPHIRQLQDSVDAMAIELERISEGQRFTAKLLAEKSRDA
jgi:hypothetical protein